jgi:signal peptidase I
MEPAYLDGCRVRVRPYGSGSPDRGDVVVIRSPIAPARLELKRIIGLPDEEVAWTGGVVLINGARLDEPYARIPAAPPGDDQAGSCRLRAGEYFVAGDNRLHSTDSRGYGPVALASIAGNAAGCPTGW